MDFLLGVLRVLSAGFFYVDTPLSNFEFRFSNFYFPFPFFSAILLA